MKILALIALLGLTSCSSYQVSLSGDGKKVGIAKNTHFFGFSWGEVRVCDIVKNETNNCVSNKPNFTSPYHKK